MAHAIPLAQALRVDPNFILKRGSNAWQRQADENGFSSDQFGGIAMMVVQKDNGELDHDRGVAWEPPQSTVNGTLWYEKAGIYYIGIIEQERPFAVNEDGSEPETGIIFAQPVMAFRRKLLGENIAKAVETGEETIIRESLEEAGIRRILSVRSLGYHWPNPTFVRSATEVWDLEVDPDSITGQVDTAEFIRKFAFIPVTELEQRIKLGVFENVNYRAAIALSTWTIWRCFHPEA